MRNDQRALTQGRRQQKYDREGATSFQQENYGGGGEYRGELEFGGFSDQDFGSQGYSGQGYGDRSYGDPDYGGQTFARRTEELDPDPDAAETSAEAAHMEAGPPEDGELLDDEDIAALRRGPELDDEPREP